MRLVLLAVRFLTEIAMLVALAAWGWLWPQSWVRVVLAVAAPALAAAVWGWLVAPASGHRLADPSRLLVEIALFAATTAALLTIVTAPVAISFAAVAMGSAVLLRLTPEHAMERRNPVQQ